MQCAEHQVFAVSLCIYIVAMQLKADWVWDKLFWKWLLLEDVK